MTKHTDLMERARRRSAERAEANAQSRARAEIKAITAVTEPEERKIPRRKPGLVWLHDKRQLTDDQFTMGVRIGLIFSEASRAEQPGVQDNAGVHVSRGATPSMALWRLRAISERRALTNAISRVLPERDAGGIIDLLERICHHGHTVRDLAEGDKFQAARLEERLKIGIALAKAFFGDVENSPGIAREKDVDVLDQIASTHRYGSDRARTAA